THKLGLVTDRGPAQPVERSFTLTCSAEPQTANLTLNDIQTPVYQGDCTGSTMLRVDGHITTDKPVDIRYRLVVDGKPGVVRTLHVVPGYPNGLGDFWYSAAKSSMTGTARIELLNQNKPVKEAPYTLTCKPIDPNPGTVRIRAFRPVAYYGDCVAAPYVTAHAGFQAAPGTEITYRWVVDGKPWEPSTHKTSDSGYLDIQAAYWHRDSKTSGVVKLEVLNHNKPSAAGVYPVTCQ
ncbi:MAG: hypothetical protein HOQ38_18325, partial [Nonomuraea sp.]|nr:hypothetical protein [Nonomuraea sp.]